MLNSNQNLEVFETNFNEIYLHEKDWLKILGPNLYLSMFENGSLEKPLKSEVHGKILNYYYYESEIEVESEIFCEKDCAIITPVFEGHSIIKKSLSDLEILKCSKASIVSHLQKLNNLKTSKISSRQELLIIGEANLKTASLLIVLYTGKEKSSRYLKTLIPPEEWNSFSKVILLSTEFSSGKCFNISDNVILAGYKLFTYIPACIFRQLNLKISCREFATLIKPPIFIDTEEKHLYIWGFKITAKRDNKVYKFVKALVENHSKLPMTTELFFDENKDISTDYFSSAIKDIRDDLKKLISNKVNDDKKKKIALDYFELNSDKTRGNVNLNMNILDAQIW